MVALSSVRFCLNSRASPESRRVGFSSAARPSSGCSPSPADARGCSPPSACLCRPQLYKNDVITSLGCRALTVQLPQFGLVKGGETPRRMRVFLGVAMPTGGWHFKHGCSDFWHSAVVQSENGLSLRSRCVSVSTGLFQRSRRSLTEEGRPSPRQP